MNVFVTGPREPRLTTTDDRIVVNCCSSSKEKWSTLLSPFILGPVHIDGQEAKTMENAWQYSKVYKRHVGDDGLPSAEWYKWRREGFNNKRAVRYPMGRGAKPEYSYTEEQGRLSYIEARHEIYIPLYAHAVLCREGFPLLEQVAAKNLETWLWDFDGYNHRALNMTLQQVAECETKKMGHAFVLAMLLQQHELVRPYITGGM